MQPRSIEPTTSRRHCLLLALAALSLLAMPVAYSGGAELPHPHVFFQLWIDAAHNDFEHHHHAAEPDSAMAGMDRPAPAPATRVVLSDDGRPRLSNTAPPETREQALAWRTQPAPLTDAIPIYPSATGAHPPAGRPTRPEIPPPRLLGMG